MILYINTTEGHNIIVALKEGDKIRAQKKINAPYQQTEKLLPLISTLLEKAGIRLNQIKKIKVANKGGSFTPTPKCSVRKRRDEGLKTESISTHYSGRKPLVCGFTALRIGVITANTLGFALGVPVVDADEKDEKINKLGFSVIKPIYDKEPNITLKKSRT